MLRKPTEWYRATVQTVPMIVVAPEPDGGLRRVTLLVRDNPQIQVALDVDPNSTDARDAYWPEPPVNKQIQFELLPEQWVVARAANEIHELSIIVEYLE